MDTRSIRILLIALVAATALTSFANASTTIWQAFCGGTGAVGSGGVIPASSVLSGQGAGESSLIRFTALIMFTMLLIIAVLYMISYVSGVDYLKRIANVELGELIVTGIVVFLFLGSWSLAASVTTSTTFFHVAGTTFGGRTVYVDDCTYLAQSSVGLLLGPIFGLNIIRMLLNTAASVQFTIEPSYFGVVFSPFTGYALLDSVLGTLSTIAGGFVLAELVILIFMGFVYGLFPLFLYAGIVLRALPWTRAAGGAFIGLFVGFYIVFPISMHLLLSGYVSMLQSATINANPTTLQALIVGTAGVAASEGNGALASSVMSSLASAAAALYGTSAGGSFGLINGFVFYVIEPASFTIFAIVLSLILAFEFTETTGRLLGAPSVSPQHVISRIFK